MKKLLITCLLVLLVCCNCLPYAHAIGESSGWARIVKDYVYLYAEEESNKQMFMLEKSYYVRILDEGDKMLRVAVMDNETNFPQITGYVKRTDVELCSVAPLAPYYPTVRLSVTADSAALRLSPSTSASLVITATNTQKVSYYGKVENGRDWYYVCFGDKLGEKYSYSFGYVDVNCVSKPDIPLHPTPLVKEETPPTSTTPSETFDPAPSQTTSPTSEILLIVFVVLLAVGLTLALFLPGNIKKRNVFEQDI